MAQENASQAAPNVKHTPEWATRFMEIYNNAASNTPHLLDRFYKNAHHPNWVGMLHQFQHDCGRVQRSYAGRKEQELQDAFLAIGSRRYNVVSHSQTALGNGGYKITWHGTVTNIQGTSFIFEHRLILLESLPGTGKSYFVERSDLSTYVNYTLPHRLQYLAAFLPPQAFQTTVHPVSQSGSAYSSYASSPRTSFSSGSHEVPSPWAFRYPQMQSHGCTPRSSYSSGSQEVPLPWALPQAPMYWQHVPMAHPLVQSHLPAPYLGHCYHGHQFAAQPYLANPYAAQPVYVSAY